MGDDVISREESSVVPLLLGVVGPRDISDSEEASIASVVAGVLPAMSEAYVHSDVVMVTSIAAGTDTVAARTAHDLDYPVLALLPLEVDDYAEDFTGDQQPLSERLSLTQDWWVSPSALGASRDARYQACGRLLAALSSTLLVAWNGVPPRKPGGTADTLFYAVPEIAALPDLSGGPSTLTTERGEVLVFQPDAPEGIALMGPGMQKSPWHAGADPTSRQIDRFNRDCGPRRAAGSATLAVQDAADSLASRLQARYRWWTTLLLVLGVLTVVSVDVQSEISRSWFLGVQGAALLTVLLIWWVMNRWDGKRRFEEYRALAEGARVQDAWQTAGVEAPVADHYLQPLGADGFWIRRALRTAWFLDLMRPPREPNPEAARAWIGGQIRYFEGSSSRPGAIRRNGRKSTQLKQVAWAFVGVALLGLLPDLAMLVLGASPPTALSAAGRLAWGLGGAAAAATVAYSQLMGYSRAARRGRLSLEMYRQALVDFDAAGSSLSAQQRIVGDVGREALRETGDWLVMNISQSLRPV
jgi:hypothetical protein